MTIHSEASLLLGPRYHFQGFSAVPDALVHFSSTEAPALDWFDSIWIHALVDSLSLNFYHYSLFLIKMDSNSHMDH